jgi:copper chaperone NosL
MKRTLALAVIYLALAACNQEQASVKPPPPHDLTTDAIGYFCGMNVLEHSGPKGQIILASRSDPVWFSSARDALAFTMLPEEPKDIQAIYVSDMGKAPSWDKPGVANWVEAHSAIFVIGSRLKGGMGADEAVPFSDKAAAERFASEHGGRIVSFGDMPRDYILTPGTTGTGAVPELSGPVALPQRPDSRP